MPLTAGGQITNEVDAGSGKKTAAPERGFLPGQFTVGGHGDRGQLCRHITMPPPAAGNPPRSWVARRLGVEVPACQISESASGAVFHLGRGRFRLSATSFGVMGKHPHRSLTRLAERYGPLMMFRLGTVVVMVTSSAATARQVLRTHNAVLAGQNPPGEWHGMEHTANSVFILTPRRKWRALRRIGAENLLSPRPMGGVALPPLLQDAVLGMLRRMSVLAASGAPVEVGHAAFDSMMDLQWRAMFSASLDEPTSRELHGFPTLAAADLQRLWRGFSFTTHLARVTSSSTNRSTSRGALGKPPAATSARTTCWACCSTWRSKSGRRRRLGQPGFVEGFFHDYIFSSGQDDE